jgi:hypothetical protein
MENMIYIANSESYDGLDMSLREGKYEVNICSFIDSFLENSEK